MLVFYLSMLDNEEERQTFAAIYEEWKRDFLHVALRITGNQVMAEDAVHNAFIAVIKNKEKLFRLPRCKWRSWIVIVTKNKAIDLMRGEQRNAGLPKEDIPVEAIGCIDISELVSGEESYRHLIECVSKLPEQYRIVFQLRYVHELNNKEIAEQLNISPNIIAMQLYRAKKVLREMLEGDGNG